MKLSCLPVSFFDDILAGRMSVREWAQMGASLGLDAIDLSVLFVPDHSLEAARKLRQDIAAAGMQVTMLTTYPDFTHPEPDQRRKELRLEQTAVEIAALLGARFVRVTAGQAHPQTCREAGIAWATEGLQKLAEATRDSGPTLVYENHAKPGAWEFTDFSQPPDIFLEIFRNTADVGLGVNFDTANATAFAHDPLDLLQQVLPRVVSLHASDTSRRGELRHVLLGTGLTPFREIFTRLKSSGWDGWICMEEASNQGRSGIEAAARFVRQTWKNA